MNKNYIIHGFVYPISVSHIEIENFHITTEFYIVQLFKYLLHTRYLVILTMFYWLFCVTVYMFYITKLVLNNKVSVTLLIIELIVFYQSPIYHKNKYQFIGTCIYMYIQQ